MNVRQEDDPSGGDPARAELRRRAEALVRATGPDLEGIPRTEFQHLVHELRTHQVELDMQNESLRAAQTQVEEARQRYYDLFHQAPVGYLTIDAAGIVLEANLTAAEMLGRAPESLLDSRLAQSIPSDDQERFHRFRKALLDGRGRQSCELAMLRADGSTFRAALGGRSTGAAGGAREIRVVLSDITEQAALRAELERSARLAAIGVLAAGIGHEINNPLTYIGYHLEQLEAGLPRLAESLDSACAAVVDRMGERDAAEILGAGGSTALSGAAIDAASRAHIVAEGVSRVAEIVRGLQLFARPVREPVGPVSLRDAIESALGMARAEIRYRARVVEEHGAVPAVVATEGRLCQVFVNLLLNAAYSIPVGAAESNEIRIRTWADSGFAMVEVRDTGGGIESENLGRVFDPFFTTRLAEAGSGLGLAVCHSIVSSLGGSIQVESVIGQGSRFTVALPIAEEVVPPAPSPSPVPGETVAAAAVAPGRARILVVDDEQIIRLVLQDMLKRRYDVTLAVSGKEAREILERDGAFDVILSDLMMPDVSGMDLFDGLAERSPELAERVIFITGGAFRREVTEFLERVPNPRLLKPFVAAEILAAIEDLLARVEPG